MGHWLDSGSRWVYLFDMNQFATPLDAKQFFITKISEEAAREGHPLDEIELKMLWFTEVGSDAKPEYLDVATQFDQKYEMAPYEKKISDLLRKAYQHDLLLSRPNGTEGVKKQYQDARHELDKEDHYLAVMVHEAFGSGFRSWMSQIESRFKRSAEGD